MADRTIKLRRLIQILNSYGVSWNAGKGKGSHGTFEKLMEGGVFTYPVPRRDDIYRGYVRSCRKKFKLTAEDGTPDEDFYNA
jgi:predicted RNA binding protein YcfA (HicA-like mRNA interferase family)